MSNEVSLTVAGPDDAAKILQLLRLIQVESDLVTFTHDFEKISVQQEAMNIERINETDDNIIMLAEYEDRFIGIVTVSRVADKPYGEVGIAVLKEFWHQGIGTLLLDETIHWGQEYSSLKGLLLVVVQSNLHAIELYQKLGFVQNDNLVFHSDADPNNIIKMELVF